MAPISTFSAMQLNPPSRKPHRYWSVVLVLGLIVLCSASLTTAAEARPNEPTVTSFTASASSVALGQRVKLTAHISAPIDNSQYFLRITDTFADKSLVQCYSGSTCSVTVSHAEFAVRTFVAHLNRGRGTSAPYPIVSASPTLTVSWDDGSHNLREPTLQLTFMSFQGLNVLPGTPVTLLAGLHGPAIDDSTYFYRIIDRTTDTVIAQCSRGVDCRATVSFANATTHTYVAHLNRNRRTGGPYPVVSSSSEITISWGTKDLAFTASAQNAKLGQSVKLKAEWNSYISESAYFVRLTDVTANKILQQCFSGWTCVATVSSKAAVTHTYVAKILSGRNTPGPFPVVTSRTVQVNWGAPGSQPQPRPKPSQPPPQPDLAFTSSAAFNSASGEIQVAVGNMGQLAAGPFTVRVILDSRYEDYYPSPGLQAGRSIPLTEPLANITPGPHVFVIVIDPLSQVAESNEDNNAKSVYFSISNSGVVSVLTP
jgi:hypothetical protein